MPQAKNLDDAFLSSDKDESIKPFMPQKQLRKMLESSSMEQSLRAFSLRGPYNKRYGFTLISKESMDALCNFLQGKKVLDAGSGTGFLSQAIADRRCAQSIVAAEWDGKKGYGFERILRRDFAGDATTLLPGDFDVVLLCWPNYDSPFAANVVGAMKKGQILIYLGEGRFGCTANDQFFNAIDAGKWSYIESTTEMLNAGHVNFQGIHDRWRVLKKND